MTIKSFLNKLFGITTEMPPTTTSATEKTASPAAPTTITVMSPMTGESVPLSQVPDPAFSEKIMGDGVAINPTDNHVYSPCDGEITATFDASKHAIGITSSDGVEILIHIGIDTVNLTNNEFQYHVKLNQKVKKGDLLITFDIDAVKSAGYPLITPIIIVNTDQYQQINANITSTISPQDILLTIK